MNDIIRAMEERRSVRKYRPDMPKKEDLELIAQAGLWAASGRGMQDCKTIIVTDPAVRARFVEANRKAGGFPEGADPFYGAPVIMAVIAAKDRITNVCDGSLVIGNMMLAAHSLGLGSIWIHRCREEFEQEDYAQMLADLGIEGDYEGIGHLAVGYVDGDAPAPSPRRDGRVYWCE